MVQTMVTVALTFIVTSILSYAVATIKQYNKKNCQEREAILCLLRSNITSTCVKYIELGYVPQQEYENVNMMKDVYVSMGGNSYVIELVKEFNKLLKK